MSMTAFSEYTEHLKRTDVPTLGSLVWFSVSESVRVTHQDLLDKLSDAGLGDFAPGEPKDDDVFRRVCTAAQRKKVPTASPGVTANYLVRDVGRGNHKVVKQVVTEMVDAGNKRLAYQPSHRLTFDSSSAEIVVDVLEEGNAAADGIVSEIMRAFQAERGSQNSYAIRELIRRVLLSSAATAVRPTGGVYFVMNEHAARIEALERFAGDVADTTVHSLPLIDDAKQRQMVKQAFEAETIDTIDRTLGEIDDLLKSGSVSEAKFQRMHADMAALVERTQQYSGLLDEAMASADFRLRVYKKRMADLFNHVDCGA
jgi:hypothetical protein